MSLPPQRLLQAFFRHTLKGGDCVFKVFWKELFKPEKKIFKP